MELLTVNLPEAIREGGKVADGLLDRLEGYVRQDPLMAIVLVAIIALISVIALRKTRKPNG